MTDIKTLEQKKQEALDRANRLQKQIEKKLNGQKFVLGGMLMAIAEAEPERIPQILADMEKYVTRKADISRISSFKDGLASRVAKRSVKAPSEPVSSYNNANQQTDTDQFFKNS